MRAIKLIGVALVVVLLVGFVVVRLGLTTRTEPYFVDVAVDTSGNIFVADDVQNQIRILDPDGDCISKFDVGQKPTAIAVDSTRLLLWVTTKEGNLLKFLSNGEFVASLDTYLPEEDKSSAPWPMGRGMDDADIRRPTGLAVDTNGNVWVAGDVRAKQFDARTGALLLALSGNIRDVDVDDNGNIWLANFSFPDTISHYNADGLLQATGDVYYDKEDQYEEDTHTVYWPECIVATKSEQECYVAGEIHWGMYIIPFIASKRMADGEEKSELIFSPDKPINGMVMDTSGNIFAVGGRVLYKITPSSSRALWEKRL